MNKRELVRFLKEHPQKEMSVAALADFQFQILLQDDLKRLLVHFLFDQMHIGRDILMDRTAALTRRRVAIEQRHGLAVFARGHRLDGLAETLMLHAPLLQRGDLGGIGTGERLIVADAQGIRHARHVGVAARL